ncbi:aldo/keto reductase [Kitasatospora sp. LaBMicrA B282]|uniref:aldo/keto reductase n=1 Tax=Kitasatospora sp. LaBMicrA B282 TaxID=3420949 RepID=UPI003D0EA0E6
MTSQMISSLPSASAAGTWQLGDLTVNRLGFGAMRLTGTGPFDIGVPRDRGQSIAVVRRAVELGVNHVDTAAFYFSALRSANELINSALSSGADDVVVTTKVGPGRQADGEWWWAEPAQLRGQVEENLRQLGRDRLDVVNLRIKGKAVEPMLERFAALAELREAGLIRHLGLSNVSVEQLAAAREVAPVVCVQNRFGVGATVEQRAVLHACGEAGIAFVPFFAIAGQGREEGPAAAEELAVTEIAAAHEASAAQVRLAWTLAQGPHVLAIPGTGNPEHLVQNVAAGALRLSEAELARLDAI